MKRLIIMTFTSFVAFADISQLDEDMKKLERMYKPKLNNKKSLLQNDKLSLKSSSIKRSYKKRKRADLEAYFKRF